MKFAAHPQGRAWRLRTDGKLVTSHVRLIVGGLVGGLSLDVRGGACHARLGPAAVSRTLRVWTDQQILGLATVSNGSATTTSPKLM